MMSMSKKAMLAAALAAAACGGKKKSEEGAAAKPAESGAAVAAAPAAAPAPASGPWAAWDMDARTKAWQGAWAGDGGSVGQKAAWSIDGATATMVDGSGEKKLAFTVDSPCTATFTEKSADGSSSGTVATYTIQNGQLITGLGDAGTRHGASAVVCGAGKIFTLDAHGCQEWTDDFGELKSGPGECGFRQDGGKDVFFYKTNGSETTLGVDGDVIWSEQLARTHATKVADLAAAKKAQGL